MRRIEHLTTVSTLPRYHRDPFNRLIIAQAQVEQMSIASADSAPGDYGATRLW